MGLFGNLGKLFGGELGGAIGGKSGRNIGGELGGILGDSFKTGGQVKRTGKALVHKGEYVLPKGVKPTATQKKAVAKNKANAKKGKGKK
jgi:hypothetical protein